MVSSVTYTKSDCDIPALNYNVQCNTSFFEPPRVTKIGLKTQEVIENIGSKVMTDLSGVTKSRIRKL